VIDSAPSGTSTVSSGSGSAAPPPSSNSRHDARSSCRWRFDRIP
jgi:hypothetical protein